ncbi:MAG TPA: hypothetical protein VN982_05315 [Candidatus Dormibacteraeota bacterium]|nr:hypothetical protein [Candidatus Dormibacteraeota bacterium]
MASPTRLPEDQSSVVLLWTGEDPAFLAALQEQLEAAGTPFRQTSMGEDQGAPTADPLPIDFKPRFGFEVSVLSQDLPAAQAVLEKLLEQQPADMEIPAQAEVPPPTHGSISDSDENATIEVWSGADGDIARFLTAALMENEIPLNLDTLGGSTRVLVSPADSARAREIVREIVEGAPPR